MIIYGLDCTYLIIFIVDTKTSETIIIYLKKNKYLLRNLSST